MMKKRVESSGLSKNKNGILKHLISPQTFGQRAADGLAKWAGSWTFILSFLVFLGLWIVANVYMWVYFIKFNFVMCRCVTGSGYFDEPE